MHKLLSKEQILTIPNILSFIRILLIPLIVWFYAGMENHIASICVVILSALTDIVDGRIARKFNMISEFGKILDPVADKFTQAALIFCIATRYKWIYALVIFFAVKEITVALFGLATMKKRDFVSGANWYGKVSTVVLYISMGILMLFPQLPEPVAGILICLCAAVLMMSFVMYIVFYTGIISGKKKIKNTNSAVTNTANEVG